MKLAESPPRKIEPDEKTLQQLVESNLKELEPGLQLVDSYVPVGKGIIDSLCLDEEGAPVVIEYKAADEADEDAFVQGLSYAAWVDQNPDAIVRFINQRKRGLLKEDTLGDARIVLICPSFGDRTLLAVTMVDADITLRKFICFEHESIGRWVHTEPVYSSRQARYAGGPPQAWTFDYHFEGNYAKMRHVFEVLRTGVEKFGGVTTYPKKHYIAFKRQNVFAVVHVYASKIELGIHLPSKTENPRLDLADDWGWSWVTHHLTLVKESDIDQEAMELIKTSYQARG